MVLMGERGGGTDFIPYWGRCPASPQENQENSFKNKGIVPYMYALRPQRNMTKKILFLGEEEKQLWELLIFLS